jgi:hypothetical protein
MTREAEIELALTTRLQGITTANGYATDAGLRVFRGKRSISEDDVPCLVIVTGDLEAEPGTQGPQMVKVRPFLPYTVEGHIACDPNNPNDAAHQLIGDVKRCLWSQDFRLGGKAIGLYYAGRAIAPRESGVRVVVAAVHLSIMHVEDLKNP